MVGYAEFSKAWRILADTPSGLVIRESQKVVFDEERTSQEICDILSEYPDADVKPAKGTYSDLLFTTAERTKAQSMYHRNLHLKILKMWQEVMIPIWLTTLGRSTVPEQLQCGRRK
jgi:hypothetical protein